MTKGPASSQELLFLSFESWSPRFDSNFYTIKMEHKESLSSIPTTSERPEQVPGKHHHPAYYYIINVFRERQQHSVFRRYSQFQWLYDELQKSNHTQPSHSDEERIPPMVFPPKTCPWQTQDEDFAQNRLEELREFLTDALKRPGVASHPAVKQFLLLS